MRWSASSKFYHIFIGIRLALGARPADALRMVLRGAISISAAGIGLVVTLALTRVLTGLLYNVSATDPLTLLAVAILVSAIAVTATVIPARSAARIDPQQSLRQD